MASLEVSPEEKSSESEEGLESSHPSDSESKESEVETVASPGGSVPTLTRWSADGLHQIRLTWYEPRTDPLERYYQPVDSDATPVRSDAVLESLLPAKTSVDDVRLDVLEYMRMRGSCSLQKAEDAVSGNLDKEYVIHSYLREDVLLEILRRVLCLQLLDDIPCLRHVPEAIFDEAVTSVETCGWEVGVDRAWPPIPTQRLDSPEPPDDDEDASDCEAVPRTSIAKSAARKPKRSRASLLATGSPEPLTSPPARKRVRQVSGFSGHTSEVSSDPPRPSRPTLRRRPGI
jgi:hypothetical protein